MSKQFAGEVAGLEALVPDQQNANAHTERGMGLLEDHIRTDGLGRSILIDANNKVIAGNGVLETASNLGIERVRIIETDGNEVIAVKRTNVDIDTAQGRRMAIADNVIGMRNLELNADVITQQAQQYQLNTNAIGITDEELLMMQEEAARHEAHSSAASEDAGTDESGDPGTEKKDQPADSRGLENGVIVVCPDGSSQQGVFEDLMQRYGGLDGYAVKFTKGRRRADSGA